MRSLGNEVADFSYRLAILALATVMMLVGLGVLMAGAAGIIWMLVAFLSIH